MSKTNSLNLLSGLTIDKAYFESFGNQLVIKTTCGKTITITPFDHHDCYVSAIYRDDDDKGINVQLEDSDSTVLLDTNA